MSGFFCLVEPMLKAKGCLSKIFGEMLASGKHLHVICGHKNLKAKTEFNKESKV